MYRGSATLPSHFPALIDCAADTQRNINFFQFEKLPARSPPRIAAQPRFRLPLFQLDAIEPIGGHSHKLQFPAGIEMK